MHFLRIFGLLFLVEGFKQPLDRKSSLRCADTTLQSMAFIRSRGQTRLVMAEHQHQPSVAHLWEWWLYMNKVAKLWSPISHAGFGERVFEVFFAQWAHVEKHLLQKSIWSTWKCFGEFLFCFIYKSKVKLWLDAKCKLRNSDISEFAKM